MEIRGKVAVITGAGSGIGRATSMRLANDGASIVIADVDEGGGAETVKLIEKEGGRAMFVRADVTQEVDARKMIDAAVQKLGGLDILYNNAGVGTGVPPFPEASLPQWRRVIDIDLTAVIMGTWIAAPLIQKHGGGAIINTASINADTPNPTLLAYATTKGEIQNFTAGLALLLAEKGIRANAVAPGPIWTPLIPSTMPEEAVANFGKSVPMKRAGQPAELATAYVMLAGPLSSYVSGATIAVTGGKPIL